MNGNDRFQTYAYEHKVDDPHAPKEESEQAQNIKFAAYVALIGVILGDIVSFIIFSWFSLDQHGIGMWYALLFVPIYHGVMLVAFITLSSIHITRGGEATYLRTNNPRYKWTANWGILSLVILYLASLAIIIYVGVQLSLSFSVDETLDGDANTDLYNMLNLFLTAFSGLSAILAIEVAYVYMSGVFASGSFDVAANGLKVPTRDTITARLQAECIC